MDWTVEWDDAKGVARITATGIVTLKEVSHMVVTVLTEAARRDITRFLADYRQVEVHASAAEVYAYPDALKGMGMGRVHKVANLVPAGGRTYLLFKLFDDQGYFSGLNQSLFTDHDQAYAWLLS